MSDWRDTADFRLFVTGIGCEPADCEAYLFHDFWAQVAIFVLVDEVYEASGLPDWLS